jgi:hypothetical protein
MRILFIADGTPDYQSNSVMHGLYKLLGPDLTTSSDHSVMYKDKTTSEQLFNLYGRGFTMWGNLPFCFNDNSDLENKIKNKHFEYIIYGSFRRDSSFIELIKQNYPKNKICFIDGEDDGDLFATDGILLFKRELYQNKTYLIRPISFALPEEKITTNIAIKKEKDIAEHIPKFGGDYVFNTEQEYYNNYKTAKFGLTQKRGGWDCMRHYEILGNYCIPLFTDPDFNSCPAYTMTSFPKQDVIEVNKKFNNKSLSDNEYYEYLNKLFEYTKTNLTTTVLAKYILDNLKSLDS